jgi:ubiquinone/menaquinone biosynthesis C-methylase UbiE
MNKNVIDSFNKFAEQYADFTFENLLQYELNRFISLLPKNGKILDAGCGSGRDVQYFLDEEFDAIGIDASEKLIEAAKKKIDGEFKIMDISNLDFDENNFDGIWALDSVSYLDEVNNALKEFNRVLKKEGILFISVREGEGEILFEHEKLGKKEIKILCFTKKEFEDILKKFGFEILNSYIEEGEHFKWINVFAKKQ